MSKEHEYTGKQFAMWWDPQNKIIHSESWGVHDEADAMEYMQCLSDISGKVPGDENLGLLGESSRLEKTTRKARKIYAQLRDNVKIRRSAVCGMNPLLKAILAFLILIPGDRVQTRLFDSAEEGLRWLKEMGAKDK